MASEGQPQWGRGFESVFGGSKSTTESAGTTQIPIAYKETSEEKPGRHEIGRTHLFGRSPSSYVGLCPKYPSAYNDKK